MWLATTGGQPINIIYADGVKDCVVCVTIVNWRQHEVGVVLAAIMRTVLIAVTIATMISWTATTNEKRTTCYYNMNVCCNWGLLIGNLRLKPFCKSRNAAIQ